MAAVKVFLISEAIVSKSNKLGGCVRSAADIVPPTVEGLGSVLGELSVWACMAACADTRWDLKISGIFLLSCLPASTAAREVEELRVVLFMVVRENFGSNGSPLG